MLSLSEIVNICVTVIALPISVGPMFAVFFQDKWTENSRYLALLCLSGGALALMPLFYVVTTWNVISVLRFIIVVMMLVSGLFFLFTANLLNVNDRGTALLRTILPVFLLLTLGAALFIDVAQPTEESFTPLPATYFLTAGSTIYVAASAWIILSSADSRAAVLRVSVVLVLLGYLLAIPLFQANLLLTPLFTAVAILLAGWRVLHEQFQALVNDLRNELRIATRDLQQVTNSVAEEKKSVQRLRQDVQTANRYKSDFISNMSHELRTPLNSIIGYSELLQNGVYGELNDKQKDRLEKIQRNSARLLDLISGILDLNRIDAGKFDLDLQPVQIQPLVDQVVLEITPRCREKALQLGTDIETDLPELLADEHRLLQVINNMLDNAVKFTREGEISIHARSVKVTDGSSSDFALPMLGWLRDGVWVVISVKDSGIGIAPEDHARVFEEFSQVEVGPTREYDGTGMGLAISKRLVEMHQGVMWVKSSLEQGSTFFVALPTNDVIGLNSFTQAQASE